MVAVSGSTNGPDRGTTRPAVVIRSEVAAPGGARLIGHEHDACERLHDRMLGELVMRHATGQRVLDLGRGVPQVTTWVAQRAASLAVVDAADLGRGDTITLPWPDASFSLVYCVRTLPHLGRDPETSDRAARCALAEVGRVLEPGGTALVEIDNPLSLWGAVHGLRRPAKALEPGPMCIESARGLTRFETLSLLVDGLPKSLVVSNVHGLRIVAPVPHLLAIPLVGRVLKRLEWALRDQALLCRMGGHLVVALHHVGPPHDDPPHPVAAGGELVR